MIGKNINLECNLCGSNNYEIVYKVATPENLTKPETGYKITEWNIEKPKKILKCNGCGLIFAEQDKNLRYYADKYITMVDKEYVKEEKGRRRASIKILEKIEKVKKGGKLLDIGCANGFFLDEARRRGWEVDGIEVSSWAVEYARKKLNLNVREGFIEKELFPDDFFDVIVMLDVLEHLPDPKSVLIEARRILKGDGILYISTPNISSLVSKILRAKWWGINKFHLYYFSKHTFEKMLDACGFKVKGYSPHIRIFSFNYWVSRIRAHSRLFYRIFDFISRIDSLGSKQLTVNFHDQIEAVIVKARKLDYLVKAMTVKEGKNINKSMKIFVVLPAFNAEKTLQKTVEDIPRNIIDKIILTDDNSSDKTVEIAENLGLEVLRHKRNMGYGANQKTCYKKALEEGADIVIMVHPDYQYDPTIIPSLIEPIQKGEADAVFGSRMLKGGAVEGGMPLWKRNINILLTAIENIVLGTYLTDYHSGFRAYSANLLRTVSFSLNSNKFIFDTEIIVQSLVHHFKIEEVPIKARYFEEASTIKLLAGIGYCFDIFKTMFKYVLHIKGVYRFRQFE